MRRGWRWAAVGVAIAMSATACTSPVPSSGTPPAATTAAAGTTPASTTPASSTPTATTTSTQTATAPGSGAPGTPEPGSSAPDVDVSPPPTTPAGPPSSEALIATALANGTIDASTALLYRIWAQFGDPQLPAAYVSKAPIEEDQGIADQTADGQGTIPANVWAKMQPYLVRPTDPTSAFYPVAGTALVSGSAAAHMASGAGALARSGAAADSACTGADPWTSQPGTANFRVWAPCTEDYASDISSVVGILNTEWKAETDLMGQPIADDGTGGDTRIDFYLIDSPTQCPPDRSCPKMPAEFDGLTYNAAPFSGSTSSAFVLIPRSIVETGGRLTTAVVHEFWHVLEDAYNAHLHAGDASYWFVEASAAWAEANFVPSAAVSQVYDPRFTRDFQGNGGALNEPQSAGGNTAYRSFIWPYFMAEVAGGPVIVARAWKALSGATSFDDADKALDGNFSFDDHFAEFAFEGINEHLRPGDPVHPAFDSGDARFPVAALSAGNTGATPYGDRHEDRETITITPEPTTVDYPENLTPLTSRYRWFDVNNDVESVTVDLSQLDGGDVVASALVLVSDGGTQTWQRRELDAGATTWCLSDPGNDIRAFQLVLSNAAYESDDDAQGTYSVTGRDTCARVHGTLTWTDHLTRPSIQGALNGTTTVTIDVLLKDNGSGSGGYLDDGSSYVMRGLTTQADRPADSIYDCAGVNAYTAEQGRGSFATGQPNSAQIALVVDPTTGVAQLSANGPAQQHVHSESVGPTDCAEIDDSTQPGSWLIWCKPVGLESLYATGQASSDGKTIDMTCSDEKTSYTATVDTTEEITVSGTLYVQPINR